MNTKTDITSKGRTLNLFAYVLSVTVQLAQNCNLNNLKLLNTDTFTVQLCVAAHTHSTKAILEAQIGHSQTQLGGGCIVFQCANIVINDQTR